MDQSIKAVIKQLQAEEKKLTEDHHDSHDLTHRGFLMEQPHTATEHNVAEIFHDILGIEQMSIMDDFFTLGGDSLAAVQLIARLKHIGIGIDMADIVKDASIKQIAEQSQSHYENHIIMPLRVEPGNDKNLFFVHPVGGSVIHYKDMTDKLVAGYNCYGIQNINIYERQLVNAHTLEELAAIYLDAVRAIQPDGTYYLAGSSMGGTVAYEMACQLHKSGKPVAFVAMFDSWAGYSGAFKDKARFEQEVSRQQEAYAEQLQVLDSQARDTLMEARWGLMQLLTNYQPQYSDVSLQVYKAKPSQ